MSSAGVRAMFSSALLPFMQWLPAIKPDTIRPDIEAGMIGAILILPQSIALATLAGMPPEYGIYTNIFPVSRSKACAFLLRERNIKAMSMIGGIRDWPYEVDASPVDVV